MGESQPDVHVELTANLGRGPERIRELAARTGAERLVLGTWAPAPGARELRAWCREGGLDPFAVELVDLARFPPSPQTEEAAALVLAAAAAGLRAYEGSRPEQLRLEPLPLDGRLSRRSLLSLPRPSYRPVASIAEDRCLGARRCGLCVSICPPGAIELRGSDLAVDGDRCASCGLCVTACPTAAIELPRWSIERFEAELAVLLSSGHYGLLLSCADPSGRSAPLAPGWLPLEVPCLGMVTPGWLLQALAAGAPAVALRCGGSCRFEQDTKLEHRVGYVHSLLRRLGEASPSRRVRILEERDREALHEPLPLRQPAMSRRVKLVEPAASAEAVVELAHAYGADPSLSLVDDASPLGLVSLAEETCAACGSCAAACPTGALAAEDDRDAFVLSYEPARCVACSRCVAACPVEGTLTVRRVTHLAALSDERQILKRDVLLRCRRCGGPVAPAAMLERIVLILGPENPSLIEGLSELCADCRASGMYAVTNAVTSDSTVNDAR